MKQSEKKRIEYKLRVVGICIDYYTATRQATIKIDFYSVCNGKPLVDFDSLTDMM